MRTVFLISTLVFAASATAVCFLRDTPHHPPTGDWRIADLLSNSVFRGHVAFFFVGFLAVYVAQPFINPYLAQVHEQGYAALGVYSSIFALGTVVRPGDGSPDRSLGSASRRRRVLGLMATGSLLLLVSAAPGTWALAMLCCGAFDTLRYVPTRSPRLFGHMPLPWGYAIFDTVTGVPMVCGAMLGGLSYRTSSPCLLPGRHRHACGLLVLTT